MLISVYFAFLSTVLVIFEKKITIDHKILIVLISTFLLPILYYVNNSAMTLESVFTIQTVDIVIVSLVYFPVAAYWVYKLIKNERDNLSLNLEIFIFIVLISINSFYLKFVLIIGMIINYLIKENEECYTLTLQNLILFLTGILLLTNGLEFGPIRHLLIGGLIILSYVGFNKLNQTLILLLFMSFLSMQKSLSVGICTMYLTFIMLGMIKYIMQEDDYKKYIGKYTQLFNTQVIVCKISKWLLSEIKFSRNTDESINKSRLSFSLPMNHEISFSRVYLYYFICLLMFFAIGANKVWFM